MSVLARNVVAVIFAAGGIYLAATGKEGWGWCFVAAVICHV